MTDTLRNPRVSWRAVVLYGLNTGTHKMALAQCLATFARTNRERITLAELAEAFLDAYSDRVEAGLPQLAVPGQLTVMERVIVQHQLDTINREERIKCLHGRRSSEHQLAAASSAFTS